MRKNRQTESKISIFVPQNLIFQIHQGPVNCIADLSGQTGYLLQNSREISETRNIIFQTEINFVYQLSFIVALTTTFCR